MAKKTKILKLTLLKLLNAKKNCNKHFIDLLNFKGNKKKSKVRPSFDRPARCCSFEHAS